MRPKTATASFRLDESGVNIPKKTQKQNVIVSTLLNRLILAYANYDRPMKRFRMIVCDSVELHARFAGGNQ